jgi:hypothetical protein
MACGLVPKWITGLTHLDSNLLCDWSASIFFDTALVTCIGQQIQEVTTLPTWRRLPPIRSFSRRGEPMATIALRASTRKRPRGPAECRFQSAANSRLQRDFLQKQPNPCAFNDLPAPSTQLPKSSVQHSNLPYNQGNQQFDGRPWYWLTLITYTGDNRARGEAELCERVYLKPAVAGRCARNP